jgi:hypothetical protein
MMEQMEKSNRIGILQFNLEEPTTRNDFILATKANLLMLTIEETWNRCFRPAFKHGYEDKRIQDLLEKIGDDAYELIRLIGEEYQGVKNDYLNDDFL